MRDLTPEELDRIEAGMDGYTFDELLSDSDLLSLVSMARRAHPVHHVDGCRSCDRCHACPFPADHPVHVPVPTGAEPEPPEEAGP